MHIGVIGSRSLPEKAQSKVSEVVKYLLAQGHEICHGGAKGTDHFVLKALIENGACHKGILFSAWQSIDGFPITVKSDVEIYLNRNGCLFWGAGPKQAPYPVAVAALMARNKALVDQCDGLVAFLHGESRGTLSTVREAIKKKIPIILFPLTDKIVFPQSKGMRWYPMFPKGIWDGALKAMYSSFHSVFEKEQEEKLEVVRHE